MKKLASLKKLSVVYPKEKLSRFGITPYPEQLACVQEMVETPHKKIYNASAMGCGKTAMAVMYANTLTLRSVLVITTASLRIRWAREYQLWSTLNNMHHQAFAVLSNKEVEQLIVNRKIHPGNLPSPVITSYDMIVRNKRFFDYLLHHRHWDLIILDEAHKARTLTSKSTHTVIQLCNKTERVMALSGTPMCNSAMDLFPMLFMMALHHKHLLDDETYEHCTNGDVFAKNYTFITHGQYGTRFIGALKQEKLRKMFVKDPPWTFRLELKDILKDLPPIVFDRIELNLSGKTSVDHIIKKYGLIDRYEKGDTFRKPNDNATAAMATLRKELGTQIVNCPELYSLIDDVIETDGCVIIGAFHTDAINTLHTKLSKHYKCVVVNGAVPPRARQAAEDAFQNGTADVFIGQLEASGVGINLSRAQQVIVVELDWLPHIMNQFIARPQRIGQKGSVVARFICTRSEIHTRLLESAIRKQKAISYIVEGIGGPSGAQLSEKTVKNYVDTVKKIHYDKAS